MSEKEKGVCNLGNTVQAMHIMGKEAECNIPILKPRSEASIRNEMREENKENGMAHSPGFLYLAFLCTYSDSYTIITVSL